MECKERLRLTEEYFDALKQQNSVTARLTALRAAGDEPGVAAGEAQEQAAIEEAYEAWDAVNSHVCTEDCERE